MIWASKVYLGLFSDLDFTVGPLANMLGPENADAALQGLIATLEQPNTPTLNDVAQLSGQRQYSTGWHRQLAGLTEQFARTGSLAVVSEELLRAMLAFDLTQPTPVGGRNRSGWVRYPWKAAALRERPDLVRDAYLAVTRVKLAGVDRMIDGLRELLTDEALAAFRGDVTLELLRDFPNANIYRLNELLDSAVSMPSLHSAFLALAGQVLAGRVATDPAQHDRWLAAAYILAPATYQTMVDATARARPCLVFDLREFTGFLHMHGHARQTPLHVPQLEFLARLTGSLYPRAGHPSGGWGGDQNPWDASDYFRSLVNSIAAMPSEPATNALSRLAEDPQLASYRDEVLHALAQQRTRRRANDYDRPNWPQTVKALSNGAPATVPDLHALVLDHLEELRSRIASQNTDLYKNFWNIDGHGKLIAPRPEAACRNFVVTLLRARLAPLAVMVEPEGHMVADKRADISMAMPGRKILCELKRDYHAEVWTAATSQLERFYTRDPEAQGFGIYVVFWFGDKRGSTMPAPPEGLHRPITATEMESMLRAGVPDDRKSRIAVVVIDVSGPDYA
jgi:hypothetical protein